MKQLRPYDSPLRAEQAAMTRDRIIDAAVERLRDGDAGDLAMQDVADDAGVSVRTVYRHFATRDDLLDGVVEAIGARLTAAAGPPPETADDYGDRAHEMVRAVLEIEPMYRALFATSAGRASHQRSAHHRRNDIRRAFDAELADLDERQAARFSALMHLVTSSNTVLFLRDYWGLDAEDAGHAVRWAVQVLTGAIRKEKDRRTL